ncbi:unnamed protein product [Symbiodinium natans]|uniref:Uncharacterized protein n=1 Tax=Symbiodinium natans TaxID=878477 RepID=A0A812IB16_9DINO|nr:unnamed protein product [Symbiodinium natans]
MHSEMLASWVPKALIKHLEEMGRLDRSESILDFSAKWDFALRGPDAFDADGCENDAEQRKYFECLSISDDRGAMLGLMNLLNESTEISQEVWTQATLCLPHLQNVVRAMEKPRRQKWVSLLVRILISGQSLPKMLITDLKLLKSARKDIQQGAQVGRPVLGFRSAAQAQHADFIFAARALAFAYCHIFSTSRRRGWGGSREEVMPTPTRVGVVSEARARLHNLLLLEAVNKHGQVNGQDFYESATPAFALVLAFRSQAAVCES